MNERIFELAKQANANELSYAYYRGEKRPENAVTLHSVDLELFAELIVRECMDVASPSYMSTPEQGVYYVEQAIGRIAEHFGVES